jgi:hypothetical protein
MYPSRSGSASSFRSLWSPEAYAGSITQAAVHCAAATSQSFSCVAAKDDSTVARLDTAASIEPPTRPFDKKPACQGGFFVTARL